ncbi:Uncharacterized protein FKW44_011190, partial [Caligus rogercresseyi]
RRHIFLHGSERGGSSDELSVSFEVLYPPRNMEIAPSSGSIDLRPRILCDISLLSGRESKAGNPMEPAKKIYTRGNGHSFELKNSSYQDKGNGPVPPTTPSRDKSEKIHGSYFDVDIIGSPQIFFQEEESQPLTGGLSLGLGSLELFEGQRHGRFFVPPIQRASRDCYKTELVIERALAEDSRMYISWWPIRRTHLRTFSLSAVLGAGISVLIILIILCVACVLLVRKKNGPLCLLPGASTDNLHEYIERSLPDTSNVITVSSLPPPATNVTVQKPPYADIHFRKKYSYLAPHKASPGHLINLSGLPHPSHSVTFRSENQADV